MLNTRVIVWSVNAKFILSDVTSKLSVDVKYKTL